ncbi:hypothetical protein BDW74DRAFT_179244 [Aspergillus multicolor]|uniref:uncharacterized protein n=1 Tax=Aspergillus multicolor TaxID=41759 RepID=UPI003CCDA382
MASDKEFLEQAITSIINPILMGITSFHVLELLFSIFLTFERRQGLYFWSILISTLSLAGYAITSLMRYDTTDETILFASGAGFAIAYPTLITAHILTLYSRLNLVLHSRRLLRGVLVMILATSALSVPTQITVATMFSALRTEQLYRAEHLVERTVLSISMAREFVICGIYIVQAYRSLHPIAQAKGKAG